MSSRSKPLEEMLDRCLADPEEAFAYLDAVLESGDTGALLVALGDVVAVLEREPTALYGQSGAELTEAEMAVLRASGVDFDRAVTHDPFEDTAVLFAAIIESSLSTAETAERLGVPANQVRQMIARRTLYSIKLDERRHVPLFQFRRDGGALVPNVTRVNPALPTDLHPIEVYDWYTVPEPDLSIGDDEPRALSPLEWLDTGGDAARVIAIARQL